MSFPRLPTDEEKTLLADLLFDAPPHTVDWTGVWMLTEYVLPGQFQYNCLGWSLLLPQDIPLADRLDTVTYLYGRARAQWGASSNYVPAGGADAVIQAWGTGPADILHVTRFITRAQLEALPADTFRLKLDFNAPAAQGFPDRTWTSKIGTGTALITHPADWLQGSIYPNLEETYVPQP